jgi:hypothetical protein
VLDRIDDDYTVFVHVEDVDGRVERMNLDHKSANGMYPTAHFTQRDHLDRSIVITWIGHRDRSAATLGEFTC